MRPVEFLIPIRTRSTSNLREHWAARAARIKRERRTVAVMMPRLSVSRATVTLTRIAPRELDDDNLRGALKGIRDQAAVQLGLKDDRDPRVAWAYAQQRGAAREYAVLIAVTEC